MDAPVSSGRNRIPLGELKRTEQRRHNECRLARPGRLGRRELIGRSPVSDGSPPVSGDPAARLPITRQPVPANKAEKPRFAREPDFSEALTAAQSGANWAMTLLYRRFNPALVRYLRVADPRSYEDLVAEVWMSVAAAIKAFRGDDDDFRAWLYTIARNRLIDFRRRAARHPIATLTDDELQSRHLTGDPGEELTERLYAQVAVHQLVSVLPATQSQVVLLRVVDGLDVADVARIMGRSPGWVRVTQHRALLHLARLLSNRRTA
jgi:RNA polymerase sigma-70 factor, ECF subfamily